MWILLSPVIVLLLWMALAQGGEFLVYIVLGGLLLGTLWQILQELIRLRHAYEEQTQILRRDAPRPAPSSGGEEGL